MQVTISRSCYVLPLAPGVTLTFRETFRLVDWRSSIRSSQDWGETESKHPLNPYSLIVRRSLRQSGKFAFLVFQEPLSRMDDL